MPHIVRSRGLEDDDDSPRERFPVKGISVAASAGFLDRLADQTRRRQGHDLGETQRPGIAEARFQRLAPAVDHHHALTGFGQAQRRRQSDDAAPMMATL